MKELDGIDINSKQKTAENIIVWQLLFATFFQKLAVPVGGGQEFFLSFFAIYFLAIYGLFKKTLFLDPSRLLAYFFLVGFLSFFQLFSNVETSFFSFIPLLLIHIHYIFVIDKDLVPVNFVLHVFQRFMFILAIIGILQYFLQYIIGGNIAFAFDYFFPKIFYKEGFNSLNEISYGSRYFKSNGFFFLEPSIFCQFLSIALIVEYIYKKNVLRFMSFLLAIALTFSGTGLIILFIVVPLILIKEKRFFSILMLIIMALTASFWAPIVGLETQLERASEITNSQSSGYARFISMIPFMAENILPYTSSFFFGRGGGSIPWDGGMVERVDYILFNPTWAKIFFEYGLLGFITYTAFIIYCFKKSKISFLVKLALFIELYLMGEFAIPPTIHGLIFALIVWTSSCQYEKKTKWTAFKDAH